MCVSIRLRICGSALVLSCRKPYCFKERLHRICAGEIRMRQRNSCGMRLKYQAADVVKGKEGGLDYVIEQGGRNLSGGQKQRLTIARAVVKDPEILILDDSASALDFATDARLSAALRNLQGNKTIFIVSQRTSSIQFADQILVMDDGQAVGLGTHEELLENCEIYREIYESQFKKEDLRKNGGAGNV